MLEQLVDELEPKRRKDFDKLVDHGLRPRTGSSAMNRAEKLGLYEVAAPKKKRGPAWDAQGRQQGDKNAPRVAAAKRPKTAADSTLLSPVGASPSEPREKRKAAALGEAARRAEPEEAKRQALPLTVDALLGEKARRLQIAIYFLEECDAPAREEWKVRKGTVYDIYSNIRGLGQNDRGTILMVLNDLLTCAEAGVEYTGERKITITGRPPLLELGSEDARIVARAMEKGLGLRKTHFLLSQSRHSRKLEWVGLSAVYGLHLRLKPVVTMIEDCKQGKSDPDSHWAMARDASLTQLALRLGHELWSETGVRRLPCLRVRAQGPAPVLHESPVADADFVRGDRFNARRLKAGFVFKTGPKGLGFYRDSASKVTVEVGDPIDYESATAVLPAEYMEGPEPLWYCKERLPPINIRRVATGDEVHMEPTIAAGGVKGQGSQKQYRYHWDQDGNPVPEATQDTTLGARKFKMKVKYTEQTRVMLATALVPDDHPCAEKYPGTALPTYDYTGKWLDSIGTFDVRKDEQKKHIQNQGTVTRWVTGRRDGELYENDGVEHFPRIRKVAAMRLRQLGISTVAAVGRLSQQAVKSLGSGRGSSPADGSEGEKIVPQLSEDFLRKMQQQAKNAKAGSHPAQVDHRLAEDPYLSRYGKEEGERQLIEDVRTKGAVCVTELITALFGSAEMFYRKLGETHPSNDPDRYNDWWVYHDALAQMTDERCREWMEERGWYCRWIVPLFGLNDKVYGKSKKGQWTFSTAYKCRPVGDTPELVDLDCHLNKDARDCTEFHS
eukprot:COSAG06_NODE_5860_length_3241_cov_9.433164_2_plen_781_part_01